MSKLRLSLARERLVGWRNWPLGCENRDLWDTRAGRMLETAEQYPHRWMSEMAGCAQNVEVGAAFIGNFL